MSTARAREDSGGGALRPSGILRLEMGPRQRRGSVEFRNLGQIEPASPQPSIDRLSVTFAPEERSGGITRPSPFSPDPTSPVSAMERGTDEIEGSEEEDYSASVSAIMMRRASTRKGRSRSIRRRGSSPFSPDAESLHSEGRRRSSALTTSSAESGTEPTGAAGPDEVLERLRLHKEVLAAVRTQPWRMRRKLRLVRAAHSYVRRHEGELRMRLAAAGSARDAFTRAKLLAGKKMQHLRRELKNLLDYLTPWEHRIKQIESHFGSVVASYFTFLRWLFWVNLVITVVVTSFMMVPEILIADKKLASERKEMQFEERQKATNLVTLWNFEGILKYSPLFYGYYTNQDGTGWYRLPLAYFITELVIYIYSFVATLRKMAKNSRMSKLSEKEDECVFTWKLFTGWDYIIGHAEAAHNRTASLILGFKEALLEEAEKKREDKNWRVIASRIFVNLTVLILLIASAYAVVFVVQRSTEKKASSTLWGQNETTIVLSLISIIFPIFFEVLGFLECYHPRKQLRLQLARVMVLNLLNLYSLTFSSFVKIEKMSVDLEKYKNNSTNSTSALPFQSIDSLKTSQMPYTVSPIMESEYQPEFRNETSYTTVCRNITINCTDFKMDLTTLFVTLLLTNGTNTAEFSTTPAFESSPVSVDSSTDFGSEFNQTISTLSTSTESNDYDYDNTETIDANTTQDSARFDLKPDTHEHKINTLDLMLADEGVINFNNETEKRKPEHKYPEPIWENVDLSSELIDFYDDFTSEFPNITFSSSTNSPEFNFSKTPITATTLSEILSTITTQTEHTTTIETIKSTIEDIIEQDLCIVEKCENITIEIMVPYTTKQTVARSVKTTTQSTTTTELVKTLAPSGDISMTPRQLTMEDKRKLRDLCWETMFGQELVKLTIMDMLMTILQTLLMDFFRALFVRYMNRCWCWDLEKKFPMYGDFKIAENILHLVNNQGMVWMGLFFSPGLAFINLAKLTVIMYLRSWTVLTCNVPHEVVFRASRSNNFYLSLLLIMLFLCVLPVGYAIVWVKPSWHCGPFSEYDRISQIFTKTLLSIVPPDSHQVLFYMASPGIVIPLLVLLILIIYYLMSLTNALREANHDLKIQLRRERTEERRKMFQLADRRRKHGSAEIDNTPFSRWKKILPTIPTTKPIDQTDVANNINNNPLKVFFKNETKDDTRKQEVLSRLIKRLRNPSATSEEDSVIGHESDVEPHDSIPDQQTEVRNKSKIKDGTDTSVSNKNDENKMKHHGKKKNDIWQKSTDMPKTDPHYPISKQDSLTSENIPVITISKTESSENILESPTENKKKSNYTENNQTVDNTDDYRKFSNNPEDFQEIKHVNKSFPKKELEENTSQIKTADNYSEKPANTISKIVKDMKSKTSRNNSKPLTQEKKTFDINNDDQTSEKTKTESSSDYKE